MSAEEVLKKIEKEGGQPIVGQEKGQVLVDSILRYKPKRILEVGTNVGYSSILMSNAMPDDLKKEASIITIEIDPKTAEEARKNIKEAGFEEVIDIRVGNALDVIPDLDGNFEMVFLDAVKTDYIDYLKLAESKLSKGAVIVADNVGVFESQLKEYLNYVRRGEGYESKTLDFVNDAVEVSIKV